MQCICVGEGSRVPNLQMELNYLDSFKSYCIFSDLLSLGPCVVPTSSLHHPHCLPGSTSGDNVVPIIPVVPVVPASSPHRPCGPRCLPRLSYPISTSSTPGDTRTSSLWSLHLLRISCIFSDLLSLGPCVVPTSSPHHPHCLPGSTSGDNMVPIIPVVPVVPASSPHRPCGPRCLPGWVTQFQPVLHLETHARRPCGLCVISASRASPPGGLLISNVVPTTHNHFKSVRNLTPINPTMHPTTHTPTNTLDYLLKWYMLKRNWIISMWWIFILYLVIWHNFTHQSTQPPILPPICNGMFANYKHSNKFELFSGQLIFI